MLVYNSTIDSGYADLHGGGVFLTSDSDMHIQNSVVTLNSARESKFAYVRLHVCDDLCM